MEHLLAGHPNLIISHTFSKAMGLAGFRLGFAIADPEVIGFMNRVRTPLNISLITHHAALAALEDHQYIEGNARKVQAGSRIPLHGTPEDQRSAAGPIAGELRPYQLPRDGHPGEPLLRTFFSSKGYIVRHFADTRGFPGDQYFRITIGTRADVERCACRGCPGIYRPAGGQPRIVQ